MSNRLFTAEALRRLRANSDATRKAWDAGDAEPDHKPVLKIYSPCSQDKWLLTELDADGDTLFGLYHNGDGAPKIGHISKIDLEDKRILPKRTNTVGRPRSCVPLHRDQHWSTDHTLTVWLEAAQRAGRITEDEFALDAAAAKLNKIDRIRRQKIAAMVPHSVEGFTQ